jgi:hypothetical protein
MLIKLDLYEPFDRVIHILKFMLQTKTNNLLCIWFYF